jgi:hypothetical protein
LSSQGQYDHGPDARVKTQSPTMSVRDLATGSPPDPDAARLQAWLGPVVGEARAAELAAAVAAAPPPPAFTPRNDAPA